MSRPISRRTFMRGSSAILLADDLSLAQSGHRPISTMACFTISIAPSPAHGRTTFEVFRLPGPSHGEPATSPHRNAICDISIS